MYVLTMSGPDPWRPPAAQSDPELTAGDGDPTYDPETDTYVGTFETTSASVAVLEALAAIKHCDPTDIDPLYETVDPDALDSVVASGNDGLTVTLSIDGFDVAVTADRRLEITPPSRSTD